MEAEILNKYVIIAGFEDTKVKDVEALLKEIQKKTGSRGHIQLLDAGLIAGSEHLYFAVLNALKAFQGGFNISRNLAVEVLLFASAQHQIDKAIKLLGIKPCLSDVAVVVIADNRSEAAKILEEASRMLSGKRRDDVLEIDEGKAEAIKEAFEITDLEVEAASRGGSTAETLKNLVIERMALLPARR
ncbi:hypothetical protein CW711_02910 [Candidatus Bathyarchaeota archaeon]|nr:MAG: hypothetical protein CW711_02910 [Candidatus Bathyarchaeota archaeon]RLG97101.1 MAG: hypothetical protein DRO29_03605 [Candidatus Bathyarchaeota archaeon]HDJ04404.1 hypothetical protein [Candidatus Bathyarchaeota archaeon]